jgi:uncharacterized protein YndB with AHSA1/START domain
MSTPKTIAFTFERSIPAEPQEVYDAWLDPRIPGNPWNIADKLILDPKVDGFFYWRTQGIPHYGRFTEVARPARIQHTWVSPNTLGHESTVTVTFEKRGDHTRMTLVHSDLPDDEKGRSHEKGWSFFLDRFPEHFREGAAR